MDEFEMTTKLEQAARQALEALQEYRDTQMIQAPRKAITALREALAEQATVSDGLCGGCAKKAADGWALYCVECWEKAEQEPVHWVVPDFGFLFPSEDAAQRYLINIESDARPTPCYAAPVRTKDLTDDEIVKTAKWTGVFETKIGYEFGHGDLLDFARAVIAADREKNK